MLRSCPLRPSRLPAAFAPGASAPMERPALHSSLLLHASLLRVRPLDPAQPLDEPFQLLIGDLGAAFSHVDRDNPPPIRAVPRLVYLADLVTSRAGPAEQRLRFGVA